MSQLATVPLPFNSKFESSSSPVEGTNFQTAPPAVVNVAESPLSVPAFERLGHEFNRDTPQGRQSNPSINAQQDFGRELGDLYRARRTELRGTLIESAWRLGLCLGSIAGAVAGWTVVGSNSSLSDGSMNVIRVGTFLTSVFALGANIINAPEGLSALGRSVRQIFRSPALVTSENFEKAKSLHYAEAGKKDPEAAFKEYCDAMKGAASDAMLRVKCAYGIFDLVQEDPNIVSQSKKLGWLIGEAGESLRGSAIMKRTAHKLLDIAPVCLSEDSYEKRLNRAKWVEEACEDAFRVNSAEGEQAAQRLIQVSQALDSPGATQHILLRAAYAFARNNEILRSNIEELLIGNAQGAIKEKRFDLFEEISALPRISREGKVAVANGLDAILSVLNPDDKLVANRLIMKLAPDAYEVDKRARLREREALHRK